MKSRKMRTMLKTLLNISKNSTIVIHKKEKAKNLICEKIIMH